MKQQFNKQLKTFATIQEKNFIPDTPKGQGIIKVSGWASKSYDEVTGQPVIDRDSEHIKSSGFDLTNAKVLLYNHDWDKAIGTIKLEHSPYGIKIEAEVHEALDAKAYYATQQGILDSFSIGFMVDEAEWIEVNGEEHLSFTKGAVYETSLVTIPSNTRAVISEVTQVKSIIKSGECTGLQCSVEALKAMNPDSCDCSMLKQLKEAKQMKGKDMTKIQEVIKGLTFNETEKETWNQYDKLTLLMSILRDTLEDNFFEIIWGDNLSAEEVKANLISTIDTFKDRVLDIEQFKSNEPQEKNAKTLVTKNATDSDAGNVEATPQPEPTSEGNAEGQTPEIDNQEIEPTKEEPTLTEAVSDDKNEPIPQTDEVIVEPTEQDTPKVEVEVPVKPTIQTIIGELATTNLQALTAEEIESLYNSASELTEKIEALVKQEVEDLA